jgi:hypothetical protein
MPTSAIGTPSLDYKKFLSDAGSGLVALVSLAIVIYICGTNDKCHIFEFVTTLYDYFIPIFSPLKNNTGISGAVIILTIILLISIMLGFIVNALSYLLLDDLIDWIVDNARFQRILEISNRNNISYNGIKKFKRHFDSIDKHFDLERGLSKCNDQKYEKCLIEIKTRLSIECPNIVGEWGEVHGGYIMFRNFIFIILFCLFFIILSFWNWSHISQNVTALIILVIIALIPLSMLVSLECVPGRGCPMFYRLYYILLAVVTPSTIAFLPDGLSRFGLEIIVISIISINILFFLSAFALTYYHYRIFIAAMYVSLGENWKKCPPLHVQIKNCLEQIIKCISK